MIAKTLNTTRSQTDQIIEIFDSKVLMVNKYTMKYRVEHNFGKCPFQSISVICEMRRDLFDIFVHITHQTRSGASD